MNPGEDPWGDSEDDADILACAEDAESSYLSAAAEEVEGEAVEVKDKVRFVDCW